MILNNCDDFSRIGFTLSNTSVQCSPIKSLEYALMYGCVLTDQTGSERIDGGPEVARRDGEKHGVVAATSRLEKVFAEPEWPESHPGRPLRDRRVRRRCRRRRRPFDRDRGRRRVRRRRDFRSLYRFRSTCDFRPRWRMRRVTREGLHPAVVSQQVSRHALTDFRFAFCCSLVALKRHDFASTVYCFVCVFLFWS